MPDPQGMHAHPAYKLGRRPHDPARPVLRLRDVLTGVVPAHPPAVDYLGDLRFGLYKNNVYGICGPTGVANSRILTTSRLTPNHIHVPSQADVEDLYRRSGNPRFDPNDPGGPGDQGVNMADMLAQVARGGLGGVKCLAYAMVDLKDPEEVEAAVAIFGGVLWGVTLQTAQQAQTDHGVWSYSPSPEWGGHAVLGGGYTADDLELVESWAKKLKATKMFVQKQADEAWVVIWPEHITDKTFLAGVDLAALARAYEQLTGRKFPAVVPPTPSPNPTPQGPMKFSGYVQTPIGKWQVELAQTAQASIQVGDLVGEMDYVMKSGASDDRVGFSFPKVGPEILAFLRAYWDLARPIIAQDLIPLLTGKKSWEDVAMDVLMSILSAKA